MCSSASVPCGAIPITSARPRVRSLKGALSKWRSVLQLNVSVNFDLVDWKSTAFFGRDLWCRLSAKKRKKTED